MGMRVPTRSSLALALLFVWGCGASEPSVSGTIRLDGQPLLGGSIDFYPEEGTKGPNAGAAIENGEYRISKGLTVGKYRVAIQSTRSRPDKKAYDPLGGVQLPAEEKYLFEDFDRIRQIDPGPNTHNFDLKEDKKKKKRQ
jgi:hypothetical protein